MRCLPVPLARRQARRQVEVKTFWIPRPTDCGNDEDVVTIMRPLIHHTASVRLKKTASSKGIGYLELVRMWVLENLGKTSRVMGQVLPTLPGRAFYLSANMTPVIESLY